MKNILVLGAGAMGAAFTVPCIDNKHKVTLCEPYNHSLVKKILSKKKYHPSLKLNLPKNLIIKNYSKELFKKKVGSFSYCCKLHRNSFCRCKIIGSEKQKPNFNTYQRSSL